MNSPDSPLIPRDLCTRCGACFAADRSHVLQRDELDFPVVKDAASDEDVAALQGICTGASWPYAELLRQVHGTDAAYDPRSPDIGIHRSIQLLTSGDPEIRLAGQSGGVSLTLLSHAFRTELIDAALVVRRPEGDPYGCESYIARSEADLVPSAGSKYTISTSLDKLDTLLETSRAFAITTLPCQTVAFHQMVRKFDPELGKKCKLIIGPYCGLNMERRVAPEFAAAAGIDPGGIVEFRNRGGAFPGQTEFIDRDGNRHTFDRTAHRILYRMYSPVRCLTCTDYGNELADLVIADCWLQTPEGQYQNPEGSAYVIARTERGEAFLDDAVGQGRLQPRPFRPEDAKSNWEMSFYHRKVRAHNRMLRLGKKGYRVPRPDYEMPAEFRPARWADRVELTAWRLFRNEAFRARALRSWIVLSNGPPGSLRNLLFEDAKTYLFTHVHDQFTFAAFWTLIRRYSRWAVRRIGRVFSFEKRPVRGDGAFHVVLTGGHGYRNAGDEAQLGASITRWHRLMPSAELTVFSPDPEYTSSHHGVHSVEGPRVTWFDSNNVPDYHLSNRRFERRFWRVRRRMILASRLYRAGWSNPFLRKNERDLIRTLAGADVVHISGGGFLTGMTRSRLWENSLLMRLCGLLGTPVILTGQTVGVFKSDDDRRLAKEGLECARLIYLRDSGSSARDINDLGIRGDHVVSLFDDALFCERCDESTLNDLLGRLGIGRSRSYVVANFHYWGMSEDLQVRSRNRFAQICDYIIRTFQCQLVFLPMAPGDVDPENSVIESMNEAAVALDYDYDYRLARGLISKAKLVLTMKHHPIVFAQGEGVPSISIALDDYYFRKNRGVMGNCGHELYCLDAEAFFGDTVTARIEEIFSEQKSLRATLATYVSRVEPSATEALSRFLTDGT